ncbi:hypothetical protein EXIGLDRAFT_475037 [Exidia glandulosa HHB12029]|uniref:F-box domain-containing protein n=1 Tax=Exidia glandulosa HHB12029 TaxID=1314781 RepID=A0A165JWQ4_EXIGL|nr:hypothetical protein EXIGLDRAFT_475037 [Exidia glandulosa HHB12029]
MAEPDYTALLPVELCLLALNRMSQGEVLSCARVSRRWRAIAVQSRNYYCYVELPPSYDAPWSASWDFRVAKFCNTLRQCRRRGVPLHIWVHVAFDHHRWLNVWSDERQYVFWPEDVPMYDLYTDRVYPEVQKSLHLVIDLTISCDEPEHHEEIYALLSSTPAPRLRRLRLELCQSDPPSHVQVQPPTLFAGSAPALETLVVHDADFSETLVPAYAAARNITLFVIHQPPVRLIAANFPNAEELEIWCGEYPEAIHDGQPVRFAARLRRLTLWITGEFHTWPDDMAQSFEAYNIPYMTVDLTDHHLGLPLLPLLHHTPSTLHVVIAYMGVYNATIVVSDTKERSSAAYIRDIAVSTDEDADSIWKSLDDLRILQLKLVTLEVAHAYLKQLLCFWDSLPALDTLTIALDHFREDDHVFWDPPTDHLEPYLAKLALESFDMDRCCALRCVDTMFMLKCPQISRLRLIKNKPATIHIPAKQVAHLALSLTLGHGSTPSSCLLEHDSAVVLEGDAHGLESLFAGHVASHSRHAVLYE